MSNQKKNIEEKETLKAYTIQFIDGTLYTVHARSEIEARKIARDAWLGK